jgi:HlyD family secretion protein
MKKRYWIIGIIVVLAIAGFFGYRALSARKASANTPMQTATVSQGSITQELSAAGTVRTGQSATLKWQTSGKVGEVLVKTGDVVEADQELASLDPTSLSTAMINARQNLIDAQKKLDDLLYSKTSEAEAAQAAQDAQSTLDSLKQTNANKLAQAEVALANAQQALKDALAKRAGVNLPNSTNPLAIEKANSEYLLAKKAYIKALNEYQKYFKRPLTDRTRYAALSGLLAAEQKMNSTLKYYNWISGKPTDLSIAQAEANLSLAQANLTQAQSDVDNLKGGPTSPAIALAEAKLADAQRAYDRVKNGPSKDDIAAAQAAVEAAQATLNQQHLTTPFAGTITDVNVLPGDLVGNGDDAFHLNNISEIFVDVQVSEVDINSLKVGQPVSLTFDAIPSKTYTGQVSEIGVDGAVSQGVVNYPVTIQITNPDADIRPAMTAAVAIATAQKDNVLIVPNQAIKTSGNQRTITVLYQGQQIPVVVVVGLNNGVMSEVASNQLKAGDEVVINSSAASTTNSQFRGGPGGGADVFMFP